MSPKPLEPFLNPLCLWFQEDLISSSGLCGHCIHVIHIHKCRQHTHTRKIKYILRKILLNSFALKHWYVNAPIPFFNMISCSRNLSWESEGWWTLHHVAGFLIVQSIRLLLSRTTKETPYHVLMPSFLLTGPRGAGFSASEALFLILILWIPPVSRAPK